MTLSSDKTIYLKTEDFQNIANLKSELEKLYLGPSKKFELEFSTIYIQPLNKIFDEIIRSNGLREVFFRFTPVATEHRGN